MLVGVAAPLSCSGSWLRVPSWSVLALLTVFLSSFVFRALYLVISLREYQLGVLIGRSFNDNYRKVKVRQCWLFCSEQYEVGLFLLISKGKGFQEELFRLVSLRFPEKFPSEVFSKNYLGSLPFGQFAQAGLSRAVARVSPLLRILSGWSTTNLFPCLLFGLAGLDQIFWNRFLLFLSPLFVFTFLSRLAEDSKWRLVKLPSCRLRIASE